MNPEKPPNELERAKGVVRSLLKNPVLRELYQRLDKLLGMYLENPEAKSIEPYAGGVEYIAVTWGEENHTRLIGLREAKELLGEEVGYGKVFYRFQVGDQFEVVALPTRLLQSAVDQCEIGLIRKKMDAEE